METSQQHQQHKKKDKKRKYKNQWADKRDKKRQKKFDIETGRTDAYEVRKYVIGSEKFDEYYKAQFASFMEDEEYSKFVKTLQEKLPVTFRINAGEINFHLLSDLLKDKDFVKNHANSVETNDQKDDNENEEENKDQQQPQQFSMNQRDHGKTQLKTAELDYEQLKMDCKPFYPRDILFELMIPKELLKKNLGLKKIHQLVMNLADSGLITRQEIVSMLPPLLLDVKADHAIFDMCAAPGSKTAQLLELIQSDSIYNQNKRNIDQPKGFVVANDADHKRAYMLAHQMNRLNTSNILIVNHQAQFFPNLKDTNVNVGEDQRVLYDRIVCDVPCSSDAAIRKIPSKWSNWSTREGQSLHPLQLQILIKGIELLKVGGKISYSTCSLNPVENEAVVAAALKYFGKKIRLIPCQLEGFKFKEGLTNWKLLNSKSREQLEQRKEGESFYDEFNNYEEVSAAGHSLIKETMFANHYFEEILAELPKCLRVMPHYQNTSGFFITIIEKLEEMDGAKPDIKVEEEPKETEKEVVSIPGMGSVIQNDPKRRDFTFFRSDQNDPDIQYIKAYYGLDDKTFPIDQLVVTSTEMKKIYYISPSVNKFLKSDQKHELSIINLGVLLFQRNQSKVSSNVECIYRITQDGLNFLVPYMTKRILWTDDIASFKHFIMFRYHEYEHIKNQKLRETIENLTAGCFVVAIKVGEHVEALTMHKFQKNLSTMIAKENLFSLHVRYLTEEERAQCNVTDKQKQ